MGTLRTRFGRNLRLFRMQREMTQEDFAEKIDVCVEFVSNIERGVNAPSFDTLERIEMVLDIPIARFFEEHA